jgi:hypothetical protein
VSLVYTRTHNKAVELHHLGQYAWVAQAFHGLLDSKVKWEVFNKEFEVSVIHPWDLQGQLQDQVYFLCKLHLTGPFYAHLILDAVVHTIPKVLTLDGLSIMCDMIFWMSTIFLPQEPWGAWVIRGNDRFCAPRGGVKLAQVVQLEPLIGLQEEGNIAGIPSRVTIPSQKIYEAS